MVKITKYNIRQKKDGTTFITLELTGGIELVQSQSNNNFYATVRTCSIPSTFDENIAKMMVGQELDGEIVRVPAEPYEFTNTTTGEVMTLTHTYAYRPKGAVETIGMANVSNAAMVVQ